MVILTHVRLAGGEDHAHISEVKWWNPATGQTGTSTRQTMVDWIENKSGVARVTDGFRLADVVVVNDDPPYIRARADSDLADNLLKLSPF